MRNLLLANLSSGKMTEKKIKNVYEKLQTRFEALALKTFYIENGEFDFRKETEGYDSVIVCGGDGTLNRAINALYGKNINLFYLSSGTVGDTAKSKGLKSNRFDCTDIKKVDIGRYDDKFFSYVLAAGTFTPIGYTATQKQKKTWKKLIHFVHALKQYKIWQINGKVRVDDMELNETFTLIMVLKSKYCFNFAFNKLYQEKNGKLEVLTIKSPSKNILGDIQLFFLFFRCFFIGFTKEYHSNHIDFVSGKNVTIELSQETPFCVDGEHTELKTCKEIRVDKFI